MPGLLTLKTDLKSLRYGQDQPGGGDSRQPYITTDINTVDTDFNRLRLTKFDDGLIRGGVIGTTNASITDTLRIGKFFLDAPKGPLFIVKQVGLQLSNPRLEVPKNPFNIAAGVPSNVLSVATNGLLQPSRIYNLGINTLLQVPLNAFGGHIIRHGLLPIQSDASKYEAIVTANNDNSTFNDPSQNNRLVSLSRKFQLGDRAVSGTVNRAIEQATNILNQVASAASALTGISIPQLNPIDTVIDDYIGGPGSVYGIGKTLIKRYSNTEDGFKIDLANQFSSQFAGKTRDDSGAPATVDYNNDLSIDINRVTNQAERRAISNYDFPSDYHIASAIDQSTVPYFNRSLKTYAELQNQINKTTKSKLEYKNNSPNALSVFSEYADRYVGERLPSSNNKIEYKNTYNEVVKLNMSWREGTREKRVGSGRQDQINLTPLFKEKAGTYGDTVSIPGVGEKNIRDLAKFRIQAINTDTPSEATWMIFRAYLTNLSDDVSAEWSDIKYAGRGDKFYIYDGFTRKMSIGFKVAALSYDEMKPMYQKLNYLMSNLMPDYNNNLMRGPLVRMTVGNYIDGQLGVLNSLSYKITNDTPWEIAMTEPERDIKTLVLPHIIEVDLGFTPIGSQTREENKISRKSDITSHIAQNWNGKGEENEFINPDRSSIEVPSEPVKLNIKPPAPGENEPAPPAVI